MSKASLQLSLRAPAKQSSINDILSGLLHHFVLRNDGIKNKGFLTLLLVTFCLLILPSVAQADCTLPAGIAGQLEYDTTDDRYEYCDGTNWISTKYTIADNLVGHWKLDESGVTTTAVDSGSGGRNGTLTNMNPASDWDPTGGAVGGALTFDGTNDFINLGTNALGNLGDEHTVALWIKMASTHTQTDSVLSEYKLGTCGDFQMQVLIPSSNGKLYVTNGSGSNMTSNAVVADGTWRHVVFVSDTNNAYIYVDGVLDKTNGSDIDWRNTCSTIDVMIGEEGNATLPYRPWTGKLDDVRIYNRALSASEIKEIYDLGKEDGLLSHWKLDETSGSTITDSVSGHDGTWADGSGNSVAQETTAAIIDTGIHYDGSNDQIDVTHHTDFNLSELTIAAWIKMDTIASAPNSDQIVAKGDWNNADSISFAFYSGSLRCNVGMIWSAGATYASSNFSTGQWYHVVCRANSAGTKIYVNGVEVATDSSVPGSVTNTNILRIGHWVGAANNNQFDGVIDDVRFYGRALNNSEISNIYLQGALANGLVSHWKMDETAGDAADSASGLTATLANGATWNADGKINGALDLDGSDDHAETASNAAYSLTSMTLAAWVYIPTSLPAGFTTILEHNRFGNNWYGMWKLPSGNSHAFTFRWSNGASFSRDGTTSAAANTWYHVVGTYDAATTTGKIYVNGIMENSMTTGSTGSAVLDDIRIGRNNADGEPWKGRLDDVRIYNRALTATEVTALYQLNCSRQGQMFYDSTNHVLKYCDGAEEVLLGPSPGAGGGGCAAAGTKLAGAAGTLQYDTTSNKMVYCDGAAWINVD